MWRLHLRALGVGGDRKDRVLAAGLLLCALSAVGVAIWSVVDAPGPNWKNDLVYYRCVDPNCAYAWTLTVEEASKQMEQIPAQVRSSLTGVEITCPKCGRDGYSAARGYRCPKCRQFSMSHRVEARSRRRLGILAPVRSGPVICEHCGVDVEKWWREHRLAISAGSK